MTTRSTAAINRTTKTGAKRRSFELECLISGGCGLELAATEPLSGVDVCVTDSFDGEKPDFLTSADCGLASTGTELLFGEDASAADSFNGEDVNSAFFSGDLPTSAIPSPVTSRV